MKRLLLFFFTILLSQWLLAQKPTVQIILTGFHIQYWPVNTTYKDHGFVAIDSAFNNYNRFVIITGSVDTTTMGTYQLAFSIADSIANTVPVTRTVTIADGSPPVIQLLGQTVIVTSGDPIVEPGFKLLDNYYADSTLRKLIAIKHSSNIKVVVPGVSYSLLTNEPGYISYHLTDPSGNEADSAVRFFTKYSVGIPELQNALASIYPNPAFDVVNIKSDLNIDRCFIMDALGNISLLMAQKSTNGLQVDVSEFDNGMYTFIIESDEQRSFSKLVITDIR